jgi:hypothetical protein
LVFEPEMITPYIWKWREYQFSLDSSGESSILCKVNRVNQWHSWKTITLQVISSTSTLCPFDNYVVPCHFIWVCAVYCLLYMYPWKVNHHLKPRSFVTIALTSQLCRQCIQYEISHSLWRRNLLCCEHNETQLWNLSTRN